MWSRRLQTFQPLTQLAVKVTHGLRLPASLSVVLSSETTSWRPFPWAPRASARSPRACSRPTCAAGARLAVEFQARRWPPKDRDRYPWPTRAPDRYSAALRRVGAEAH